MRRIMNKQKGVSPLIAAVLLIAFTMAVAAILTAWLTTFTKEQTENVGNRSNQVISCSYAGIAIYDAVWDDTNDRMLVSIANTGAIDLTDVNVYVYRSGVQEGNENSGTLQSADIKTITITSISSLPDKITITTPDCPNLIDEETSITTS